MKIQLVSDLHLEFANINITNESGADVLILSGDICVAQDLHDHPEPSVPYSPEILRTLGHRQQVAQEVRDFFKRVSFQFPHVIYVMGNHEHYHGKFDRSKSYIQETLDHLGLLNIHLLDNSICHINDVVFIGGTLWTNMNNFDALTLYHIEHMMNDFKVIRIANEQFRKFLPKRAATEHIKTKQYIETVLREFDDNTKVVVCTHHAPSFLSISDRYKDDTLMNGGYASDLSEFIIDHPKVRAWTHGHMHQCFDYTIGDTRVMCNPRGYHNENPDFNPNFVFEV